MLERLEVDVHLALKLIHLHTCQVCDAFCHLRPMLESLQVDKFNFCKKSCILIEASVDYQLFWSL